MSADPAAVRRRLAHDLTAVGETLAQASASAAAVTLDQSSVGRLTRMDAMQQQAMARSMSERLAMQKRKLEAALDRVEAGTYGCCCQCEAEIDAERLENDPAVVFCKACLIDRERPESDRDPL